ncbi:MAG: 50S ribosomal protein L6 [Candidatus Moraniibacteriota bacterium]|nr:MAG: 50S ribosomal protein L6 [Candidatus Moranbacteria bacterium]
MSRIGKKSVIIPQGVTVTIDSKNRLVEVDGPKGKLSFSHHRDVYVEMEENNAALRVIRKVETSETNALWGTTARLIENMIIGVSRGFEKKLELNGVGFRMNIQGGKMVMALGFSHPVEREIPEGIEAVIKDNTLTIFGIDKQQVGQFTANIRALKPVEPYKGKGFKYSDEIVRRKEGKKAGN